MTTSITEEQLTFEFPDQWTTSKLDDWSFYQNQFRRYFNGICNACGNRQCGKELRCRHCGTKKTTGIKAIDILAIHNQTVWLIEIKDYRLGPRTKAIGIADEIALKVRDSLATLAAAAKNANVETEKEVAAQALRVARFRVVLHLEQPQTHSRLRPRAIDPAAVTQRLRQLVKAVDARPLVLEMARMGDAAWNVTPVPTS